MFNIIITFIFIVILSYVISGYLLHMTKIYELGIQEYEKIKREILINEIKEEMNHKNKLSNLNNIEEPTQQKVI